MAARKTESARAAKGRKEREGREATIQRRTGYAGRRSTPGSIGGLYIEVEAPKSMETYVLRRLDLMDMIRAGTWPQPITSQVRRMILDPMGAAKESDRWERYMETCAELLRCSAVIPPEGFMLGELELGDLTADMVRPLFVEDTPDDDQMVLVTPKELTDLQERVLTARRGLESMTDDERELHAGNELRLGYTVALHPNDLAAIGTTLVLNGPGVLAQFRSKPGAAVAGVDDVAGD